MLIARRGRPAAENSAPTGRPRAAVLTWKDYCCRERIRAESTIANARLSPPQEPTLVKHPSQITRRTLLKQAAAAGVGAMALPQIVPSSVFGADAPSNKLNIGVLACGGRARDDMRRMHGKRKHRGHLRRRSAPGRRGKEGTRQDGAADKAKVYEDYRKLLDEEKSVDAVVIAPGQRWHVPMSKRAMLAGKHVFCEKPLAHSCAQAREIRELAKQLPEAGHAGRLAGRLHRHLPPQHGSDPGGRAGRDPRSPRVDGPRLSAAAGTTTRRPTRFPRS